MKNALYLLLNGAGGLTHDETVWKAFAEDQASRRQESEEAPGKFGRLEDAAEQLRRLSRHAHLNAQESRLLAKALSIVETQVCRERRPA